MTMEEEYRFSGLAAYADRGRFSARVRGFTFSFFTVNMGTAGLAYMIARIPERYRFEGLFTIGTVVFMIDLVLFIIFNLLIIGRFAIYPRAILTCIQHPVESAYLCAYAQAWATLIVNMTIYASPKVGVWLQDILLVLYFMQIFATLVLSVTLPLIHFGLASRPGNLQHMPPSWLLLPTVSTYVATLSYNIATILPSGQAIYVLWSGYCMLGIGLMLTIFYFAVWWVSLVLNGLPRGRYALTPFMIIGMSSYLAGGFFGLGHAAERVFVEYGAKHSGDYLSGTAEVFGITISRSSGGTFNLINLCMGLLWYGFAWWALLIACAMSIATGTRGAQGTFNPSISAFWSLAFPTTGIIVDTWAVAEALGETSEPSGIRWLDVIGIVLLFIWLFAYGFAWFAVTRKIMKREALWEGKDDNRPELGYMGEFHRASESEEKLNAA